MKPATPIYNPSFQYIPARDHDADSTKFRARQMARIAAADKARDAQTVTPIRRKANERTR